MMWMLPRIFVTQDQATRHFQHLRVITSLSTSAARGTAADVCVARIGMILRDRGSVVLALSVDNILLERCWVERNAN